LNGLPAGTQNLEIRAIGYQPKRVAVDLSARQPSTIDVILDKQVPTLNSVVVRDKGSKADQDFNGFLSRKRSGFGGKFFTAEDIEQRQPFAMTDLMRMSPGMQVSPNGAMGYALRGRGGCTPDVIIDGLRVMQGADEVDNLVRPGEVDGVEVYTSSAGVPPQYAGVGGSSCGAVLIWTKRGGAQRTAPRK
jgi:outer membrane cobalamin receptor